MKILMLSPEVTPYSKAGGLADMVASLSKEMAAQGNEVKIFTPLYSCVKKDKDFSVAMPTMSVHMGLGIEEFCKVWTRQLDKAQILFVEFDKYFNREGIYNYGDISYDDNPQRYAFMCKSALDYCSHTGWIPDVIHCHDWTSSYAPMYLNTTHKYAPIGKAATVFTIHNLQHQGVFGKDALIYAGLPELEVFKSDNCEHFGALNLLKGALYNSTKITTVSPTYAKEIQTAEYGCGLDGVVRFKAADLVGIINGIDGDDWNPAKDKFIPKNYSVKALAGKKEAKKALQEKLGLTVDASIPVFGIISRLFDQKGLDLLCAIAQPLLQNMKIQFAMLGSGDKGLENAFRQISKSNPTSFGAVIGYDNALSHLIEAGADFFVMPSRFEPCGLNQIYSMAYGTLPIVRATGGLVDTVDNYNEKNVSGTGFMFAQATTSALYNTIGWACSTWYDRKDDYLKLQKNAMKKDFSWSKSADAYMNVYTWAITERKKAF